MLRTRERGVHWRTKLGRCIDDICIYYNGRCFAVRVLRTRWTLADRAYHDKLRGSGGMLRQKFFVLSQQLILVHSGRISLVVYMHMGCMHVLVCSSLAVPDPNQGESRGVSTGSLMYVWGCSFCYSFFTLTRKRCS